MNIHQLKKDLMADLCEAMIAFEEVWVEDQKPIERPKFILRWLDKNIDKVVDAVEESVKLENEFRKFRGL